MPTKQKPHTSNAYSSVQNWDTAECHPIFTGSHGSDHRSIQKLWIQCHPNHSGSWMLLHHCIPTLQLHHYRCRDSRTILLTCVPLVWNTTQNDLRLGPPLHIPLWK